MRRTFLQAAGRGRRRAVASSALVVGFAAMLGMVLGVAGAWAAEEKSEPGRSKVFEEIQGEVFLVREGDKLLAVLVAGKGDEPVRVVKIPPDRRSQSDAPSASGESTASLTSGCTLQSFGSMTCEVCIAQGFIKCCMQTSGGEVCDTFPL